MSAPSTVSPAEDAAATRRGILFILAAITAISVNDTVIKYFSGDYPLHQMVFLRSLIGLGFSFVFLRMEGGLRLLRTATPGLHALRAGLIVMANMVYFAALAVLPLAEATALFFVAPLIITLLAIPVLGERVGLRRLTAILVGFAGVLVIVDWGADPEAGAPPLWAMALPVVAAAGYAGMQVLTRKLGLKSAASAMAIYVQSSFLIVSLVFFAVAGNGRFHTEGMHPSAAFLLRPWVWPAAEDWPLFLLMGVMGGAIGYCLSQAYRLGSPGTIASYEYVALPMAIFWGWAIWGDVPGPRTMLGIALIAGAGLYVFFREGQRARPVAAERPQRRV